MTKIYIGVRKKIVNILYKPLLEVRDSEFFCLINNVFVALEYHAR